MAQNGVMKLLIVGEVGAGKSSIIKQFIETDINKLRNGANIQQLKYNQLRESMGPQVQSSSNQDFQLKIIKIDGEKVRIQLWDQGNSKDPTSTFAPLFTRHAAGCIVIGNSLNLQSIKKAGVWKETFDQQTQNIDEPPYPCALFINHHGVVPFDDEQRLRNLELQAGEPGTFFQIFHVTINDPLSIYEAFEEFLQQILNEQSQQKRTKTEAFLEYDKTVKFPKKGANRSPKREEEENQKEENDQKDNTFKLTRGAAQSLTKMHQEKSQKQGCKC